MKPVEATEAMDWARVGRYLTARIEELRLTKAEVIRRSRVSTKTLDRYLAGEPIVRVDKERELAAALGWTTDSIRVIATGGEPVEADGDDRVSRLESRVGRLETLLEDVRDELAADG